MKKGFKRLLTTVFFLVAAVAIVVGCSGNLDTSSKSNNQKVTGEKKEKVELTISAATSLQDALIELQKTFEKDHSNIKLKFNFGSSGALQQQIAQGAPVDLFFSAAKDKFDALVKEGLISKEDGVDLVGNELVLVVPKDTASGVKNFGDLTKKEVKRISIGTPESVPAGQYAKESFKNTKIWTGIESKVVYAKDVRQVLSYVETGNVDAGVVYKTDALSSNKVNIVATADKQTHTPIIYPVGIIKDTKHRTEAKEFYKFLQSKYAMKTLEKYGFTSN
ncbi:Molybdate-binding protein ModA [Bacillus rhizoplanae]|uniref:Molybdate-binding protein ModA n=1 Tax=Bacillus rhizoplanae TaxID=2880966 RepID=A0ABM8Y698_9BACI|nr:molybdate ABC transporter substrate-binding protein [Bacillus rhizoplanae]CAG9611245.1 Molybdate-binding protein ModA [Bacillus rhizoplanae]